MLCYIKTNIIYLDGVDELLDAQLPVRDVHARLGPARETLDVSFHLDLSLSLSIYINIHVHMYYVNTEGIMHIIIDTLTGCEAECSAAGS